LSLVASSQPEDVTTTLVTVPACLQCALKNKVLVLVCAV